VRADAEGDWVREYGDDWRRDGREWQEPRGGQQAWSPEPDPDPWAGYDDGTSWRTPPQRDPWGPRGEMPDDRPSRTISRQPPQRDPWGPRGEMPDERPSRTIPRQTPPPDPRPMRGEENPPRRAASSASQSRSSQLRSSQPRSWRQSKLFGPLILILVPLLGAVASGPGLGILFAVASVAAALGAALLCTTSGLWWIVPCTPTALLAVAFAWVTAQGLNNAKTTVAAATNVFQGVAGAFPGIAAGTAVALIVAGVRVAQGRADTRGNRA
jgi:hypothetical protein